MATGSDKSHTLISRDPTLQADVGQPPQGQVSDQSRDASSCLSAVEWPLRRYGRFMPGNLGTASGSWKVLESNEESGFLVLSIVISGHFFISRGKEVLSSRMFRIQFTGDSKTQAAEHCHNCVQKLSEYVSVQITDALRPELQLGQSLHLIDESQLKDTEQSVPMQHSVVNLSPTSGTMSVAELAQHSLMSNQLPLAYQQSTWSTEDLSSFIRLCLLDQHFPAFVEEVENQLKKIING